MAEDIRSELIERYELLSKTVDDIEKRLKDCPDGRINIKLQGNREYYYHVGSDAKEKYLSSKDRELIDQLMQKSYLEKALKIAKKEIAELAKALRSYPEDYVEKVFEKLPDNRKNHVDPFFVNNDRFVHEWLSQPYNGNSFSKEETVFLTLRGERVRSKSEVIIADRLWANRIPYKYECPVKIGNRVVYPDFTMLRLSDMKVIYHEHCGKMDDHDYSEERVVKKINDYSRAGIILGKNLFLSFESAATPLDVDVLDRLIKNCFK